MATVNEEAYTRIKAHTQHDNVLKSELEAFGAGHASCVQECDEILKLVPGPTTDWDKGYVAGVQAVRAVLRAKAITLGVADELLQGKRPPSAELAIPTAVGEIRADEGTP